MGWFRKRAPEFEVPDPFRVDRVSEPTACPAKVPEPEPAKLRHSPAGVDPSSGRIWAQIDRLDDGGSDRPSVETIKANAKAGNLRLVDRGHGNLITSLGSLDDHRPILDLDLPHTYVPSSTPGHGHLYLDVALSYGDYKTLLMVLRRYGIVGVGSVRQLEAYGMSAVLAPGITKRPQQEYNDQRHVGLCVLCQTRLGENEVSMEEADLW